MNFKELTVKKTIDLIDRGEVHPKELVEASIKEIEDDNTKSNKLNAIIFLDKERAIEKAKKIDRNTSLKGLPIIIKNNMNYKSYPIDCSSNMMRGYVSPYTCSFLKRLEDNGALIYGVSNMDEFAMGSSNETSSHGVCRNPIHRDYVPGGSSGGSASAVGAGQAIVALGSDTGGSIRQPATFCGIVGMKPTYGRVSRYGMVAYASSLDQAGPLTKTVEDSAIMLNYMCGFDENDSNSSKVKTRDFTENIEKPIRGKRIALVKDSFEDTTPLSIQKSIMEVKEFYEKEGCSVDIVDLPIFINSLQCYYVLSVVELVSNLFRFDGVRFGYQVERAENIDELFIQSRSNGFGEEAIRRNILANIFLQHRYFDKYYNKANAVRELIRRQVRDTFMTYDAILSPTAPKEVFKIGEVSKGDPTEMYKSDLFLTVANMAGTPSISLCSSKDKNGLPLGFNLMGNSFDEETILNLAHIYQKQNPISYAKGE